MYISKYTPVKSLLIQDAAAVPVMVVVETQNCVMVLELYRRNTV